MNRGRTGQPIFGDDRDRHKLLSLLGGCSSRWGVHPVAYCLMDNHYHALLQDEEGRLSRAMQHVDGVFTQWYNRRHNSDGSLMRGRYRSRVVQEEDYVAEVVRYIHCNPIGPGLVERAGDYQWSSHRLYLNGEKHPWCRYETVLDLMGFDLGDHTQSFDDFVHERVDDKRSALLNADKWSPILGDQHFIDSCRNRVRKSSRLSKPEIPEGRRLAAIEPEQVIAVACKHFHLSHEGLVIGKRGSRNTPRLLTMLVCQQMTPASLAKLGNLFGIGPRTASCLVGEIRGLVDSDEAVAAMYTELVNQLKQSIQ